MSPTLPSPMAKWSPVPFVIGPLNGGLKWPPGFGQELSREKEWMTYLCSAPDRLLLPHRATTAKSAAILASFPHTIADLPQKSRGRIIDFPEVGIDPELFSAPPERSSRRHHDDSLRRPPRTIQVPRYPPPCACGSPGAARHRFRIVGDGPDRERMDQIVREHGLASCVEFMGRVPQARVGEIMREADIFVFPSIRELGAGAVVEAMACGLACLVVDYGAPGGLVAQERRHPRAAGQQGRARYAFCHRAGSARPKPRANSKLSVRPLATTPCAAIAGKRRLKRLSKSTDGCLGRRLRNPRSTIDRETKSDTLNRPSGVAPFIGLCARGAASHHRCPRSGRRSSRHFRRAL